MLEIKAVHRGSLAEELGLDSGTQLLSINGRELNDFLDWEFLTADDFFTLAVRSVSGDDVEIEVERPEGLPLGVELTPPEVIVCSNRCDFCFVKGNPKGLRRALYARDDDYRLSFRYGNFVTLTNLLQKDVDRIIEYHLTPLYVSVHATDLEVRRRLLGNADAPDVLEQLKFYGERGIQCHTQVVIQPGINDGPELNRTLDDLYALGDIVLSVSVVPVGLTNRNQKRTIRMPTEEECRGAIVSVDRAAFRALEDTGKFWAYGSDELYLKAGRPLPTPDRYDDFDQLENGVGVVRYFQQQIMEFDSELPGARIGVATGTAMGSLFPEILADLETRTQAQFELIVLENDLFGPSVTTAGLLSGRSFVDALKNRPDIDLALVPGEALNDDDLFLDDVSFSDLQEICPTEVRVSHWLVDALGESTQ